MLVSTVTEDYLKLIYTASEWGGQPASVSYLAQQMGVVASTASENVRKLTQAGLVNHRPYQGITLTPTGQDLAMRMVRRHRLLETYLHSELGFDWDEVHQEADTLEHAVSDRLVERICQLLGHPTRDPHGDPIPGADGVVELPQALPLAKLAQGQVRQIVRISDAEAEVLRYLEAKGVILDATIEVCLREEFAGICTVLVAGERIELGEPAVAAIWVGA